VRLLAAIAAVALACAPAIRVLPGDRGALTSFRVRASATRVELSGTMTDWRAVPLERHGGVFELELDLPPGRYEYRLEIVDPAGTRVIFPEGGERTSDGFGGENAVVRVQ
jgi:1,4-alpha-glucan branching enzyme